MFPQLAQTLYSPALADLSLRFAIPAAAASQAMSVYLAGFAAGVLLWGRAADRIGRRPALLGGLLLFCLAAALGLGARSFTVVLAAQALAATGAAAGSVVTQTLLRDHYQGPALARVFSWIGMALAFSPALGLASGSLLVAAAGYAGVQGALLLLAALLALGCRCWLPAAPGARGGPAAASWPLLRRLLADRWIWSQALLVTAFNVAMYGYYALGPFLFQQLRLPAALFAASGALLAIGTGVGAWANAGFLARGLDAGARIRRAAWLLLAGAGLALLLGRRPAVVLAMLPVVAGFGLAIPNLLGQALRDYRDCLGTAGALFGLLYYLLIGAAMALVGAGQALAPALLACALLALGLSGRGGGRLSAG
nr:MFS transporter [Stenotrophomonas mori]